MPPFVFDVVDGSPAQEAIAITLRSAREARLQAIRFAGELLTCESARLLDHGTLHVAVRTGADRPLFSLTCVIEQAPDCPTRGRQDRGASDPEPGELRPH